MKYCIDCGELLVPGDEWPEVYQNGGVYRHVTCDRVQRTVVRRVEERSSTRLFNEHPGPDSKWRDLSLERRKAELAYQRELDATNGITAPAPAPVEVPLHPQLRRIREERANAKIALTVFSLDSREKQRQDGFVYIITNAAFGGVCKIGYAADPYRRLQAAQTWCPGNKFVLFKYIYSTNARELEKLVHAALDRRGLQEEGEWFLIQENHAENLIEKIKKDPAYL